MRSRVTALAAGQPLRRAVVALYVATSVAVVLQRGIIGPQHNVFRIFRQSFWHLVAGRNLYTAYPSEQGGAPADLFKYSPTAALFFAPFALPPYGLALLAWSLLGALLLFRGLTLVLERERAVLAALLVFPDLFASLQACSSNAQVAALIILAYAALEHRHQLRGAVAIVAGAALKIFPLAAIAFALLHPRRRRFALILFGVGIVALLLPLVVTSLLSRWSFWARRCVPARWFFARSTLALTEGTSVRLGVEGRKTRATDGATRSSASPFLPRFSPSRFCSTTRRSVRVSSSPAPVSRFGVSLLRVGRAPSGHVRFWRSARLSA